MPAEVVVAVLSLVGTLLGSLAGIIASNRLVVYRIEQLEKAVAKHNTVVERIALLEQDDKAQWKRLDEIKTDVEQIKKEVASHAD